MGKHTPMTAHPHTVKRIYPNDSAHQPNTPPEKGQTIAEYTSTIKSPVRPFVTGYSVHYKPGTGKHTSIIKSPVRGISAAPHGAYYVIYSS
jgi:hypothetical protein